MLHIPGDDIKQIKWILGGILACLIVIAVSLAPAVIPLALIAGVVYLLAMLILAGSIELYPRVIINEKKHAF